MNLLQMSPAEFSIAINATKKWSKYAITQPTMADFWENCPSPNWLISITDNLKQLPDEKILRLFAIWCAKNTPLPDGRKTGDLITDSRLINVLDVAERFANDQASTNELDAARTVAENFMETLHLKELEAVLDNEDNAAAAEFGTAKSAANAAISTATAIALDSANAAANASAAIVVGVAEIAALTDSSVAWDFGLNDARVAQSNYFRMLVKNPFKE